MDLGLQFCLVSLSFLIGFASMRFMKSVVSLIFDWSDFIVGCS